jgi:hypothetical protein
MEEEKVFTLTAYLQAIDNAYATGKDDVSIEDKEKTIEHIKWSAKNYADMINKITK